MFFFTSFEGKGKKKETPLIFFFIPFPPSKTKRKSVQRPPHDKIHPADLSSQGEKGVHLLEKDEGERERGERK